MVSVMEKRLALMRVEKKDIHMVVLMDDLLVATMAEDLEQMMVDKMVAMRDILLADLMDTRLVGSKVTVEVEYLVEWLEI
jgi:hypothetical protein